MMVSAKAVGAEAFAVKVGALSTPFIVVAALVATVLLFWGGQHAGALGSLATALVFWLVPVLRESAQQKRSVAQQAPVRPKTKHAD